MDIDGAKGRGFGKDHSVEEEFDKVGYSYILLALLE